MDEKLQEKFRREVIEKYQARAWECFANYDYYGKQYSKIETEVKNLEVKIEGAEQKIKEIGDGKEYHTQENKEKVKGFRKDIQLYEARIKSVSGLMKKFWEDCIKWREDGGRIMEQVENMKTFKMRTLAEIEEAKNPAQEIKK